MSESERTEVLPPGMPRPLGKGFVIRCFVDADHAGDEITRRSRTGFYRLYQQRSSLLVVQETGEC